MRLSKRGQGIFDNKRFTKTFRRDIEGQSKRKKKFEIRKSNHTRGRLLQDDIDIDLNFTTAKTITPYVPFKEVGKTVDVHTMTLTIRKWEYQNPHEQPRWDDWDEWEGWWGSRAQEIKLFCKAYR